MPTLGLYMYKCTYEYAPSYMDTHTKLKIPTPNDNSPFLIIDTRGCYLKYKIPYDSREAKRPNTCESIHSLRTRGSLLLVKGPLADKIVSLETPTLLKLH